MAEMDDIDAVHGEPIEGEFGSISAAQGGYVSVQVDQNSRRPPIFIRLTRESANLLFNGYPLGTRVRFVPYYRVELVTDDPEE